MERFGRPRFRGAAAPKPYAARPGPSSRPRGSMSGPPRQPGGPFASRSGGASASLLGDGPGSYSSSARSQSNDRPVRQQGSVPSEVRRLMESLGLSQADMQKLSQLPENELSVHNLAKIIGNLKQEKQGFSSRPQSHTGPNKPDTFQRENRSSFSPREERSFGGKKGLLGSSPSEGSVQNRPNFRGNRSPSDGDRHKPGVKVTVKPAGMPPLTSRARMMETKSGNGFSDRRDQKDEYYEESRLYGRKRSPDRFEPQRPNSFSQNSRRVNEPNLNAREAHGKPPPFGNERRVERRDPQDRGPQGSVHRPVGTRNMGKGNLPSLLDMPVQSKRSSSRGLLGSPHQPSSQGLNKLAASVAGGNAMLSPMMLASHADPSVLEAQIQGLKALQAQAIKLRTGESRERDRPMRRSPPPSRASMMERRMEENAKREAQIMRSGRGRVLYIKYKSPRIVESDLKQLASAFGRVTKLLIIKPKLKNGHFQAFMEMEQWDCAAAMLERYLARPPNIKSCPVDVQRSNYPDLQLKSEQLHSNKRQRSMSPIRKGTNQLPLKRGRRSVGGSGLSITTSRTERRVVSHSAEKKAPTKGKKTDARDIIKSKSSGSQDKKEDARKNISRRRSNSRNRRSPPKKEEEEEEEEEKKEDDLSTTTDTADKSNNDEDLLNDTKIDGETEKGNEIDPLDAIADELALHDEFVLMDEVGYEKDAKKEKKIANADLDGSDIDLDNVKVEMSQEEDQDDLLGDSLLKDNLSADEPTELLNDEAGDAVDAIIEDIITQILDKIEEDEVRDSLVMRDIRVNLEDIKQLQSQLQADSMNVSSQARQQSLDEGTAFHDFNVSEDEIHEYDYSADNISKDEANIREEIQRDNEELKKVQSVVADSLKEVQEAKDHLDALVKVTKAKAAQSIGRKLRVCLEVAIAHLESVELPAGEEEEEEETADDANSEE